jgi:conjugative relaxase-like TrwC/TraI family protein
MLSISNVSPQQAENYYEKDDYYSASQGVESDRAIPPETRWFGRGSAALNLSGEVESATFRQILHGIAPNGQSLHALKIDPEKHRAGTDFTFSAPKSVSIAALIQQDERVIAAHDHAVQTVLSVMENRYAQTRQRTRQGRDRINTGNLTAALFRHETSREQDPQLHTHAVVINCTQLEDGTWRSLSNEALVAHQKLLGQIYQNELAHRLRQIGYDIEPRSQGQFELKGYGSDLLSTFSTRAKQIETHLQKWTAFLEETGGTKLHASQKKQATLATRRSKETLPRDVLLSAWRNQIKTQQLDLPHLPQQPSESTSEPSAQIAQRAIAHCAERDDVFRIEQAERFALENHLGQSNFDQIEQALHQQTFVADSEQRQMTTEAAIQRELHTIHLMQSAKQRISAIATPEEFELAIAAQPFTDGQRQAIALAATTTDQFIAWQGVAGAGKTYSLKQFKAIAESAGYTVKGFCPSAEGANVLAQETGMQTDTVAMHLHRQSNLGSLADRREIWVIDEAGLLNARDANALLQKASAEQARLILVGDIKQLSAVAAGNPFKSLQSVGIQTAFLDQSLRQKTRSLKAAVDLISQGDMDASLDRLIQDDVIQEIPDRDALHRQVVSDYLNLPPEEREKTLLLAGTNATRTNLTLQIRTALQRENQLGSDAFALQSLRPKDLTATQTKYAHVYQVGDVIVPNQDFHRQSLQRGEQYQVTDVNISVNQLTVQAASGEVFTVNPTEFQNKTVYEPAPLEIAVGDRLRWTRNDRQQGRRNGQQFTVEAIDAVGMAQLRYDDGKGEQVDLRGNQYVDYALVSTTYSSQGKTSDRVLAVMDGYVSRESFYVAASRARHNLILYTEQIDKLRERVSYSSVNNNPSDYIPLFQKVNNYAQNSKIECGFNSNSGFNTTHGDAISGIANGVGSCFDQRFDSSVRRDQPAQAIPNHHLESISEGIRRLTQRRNRQRFSGKFEATLAGLDQCCQALAAIGERIESKAVGDPVGDRGFQIAKIATQYLYGEALVERDVREVEVDGYRICHDGQRLQIQDLSGRRVVQMNQQGEVVDYSQAADYERFKHIEQQLDLPKKGTSRTSRKVKKDKGLEL